MTTKYLKAILVKACITVVLQAKKTRNKTWQNVYDAFLPSSENTSLENTSGSSLALYKNVVMDTRGGNRVGFGLTGHGLAGWRVKNLNPDTTR